MDAPTPFDVRLLTTTAEDTDQPLYLSFAGHLLKTLTYRSVVSNATDHDLRAILRTRHLPDLDIPRTWDACRPRNPSRGRSLTAWAAVEHATRTLAAHTVGNYLDAADATKALSRAYIYAGHVHDRGAHVNNLLAELAGVPEESRPVWQALAAGWAGTPAELLAACELVTR